VLVTLIVFNFLILLVCESGWEAVDHNLNIAIVCIPNSHTYAMKDGLISKYAADNRIKLSIMHADNMSGEMYDVVIFSAFFDNQNQISLMDMIAAITRARSVITIEFIIYKFHHTMK
jgi:hypothetical protein